MIALVIVGACPLVSITVWHSLPWLWFSAAVVETLGSCSEAEAPWT